MHLLQIVWYAEVARTALITAMKARKCGVIQRYQARPLGISQQSDQASGLIMLLMKMMSLMSIHVLTKLNWCL